MNSGQETHQSIAKYFGLKHVGSVCYPLIKVKKEIADGGWRELVGEIEKVVFIIQ